MPRETAGRARPERQIGRTVLLAILGGLASLGLASDVAAATEPPPTLSGQRLSAHSSLEGNVGNFTSRSGGCRPPDADIRSFYTVGATGPVPGEDPYSGGVFTDLFDVAFGPGKYADVYRSEWLCPVRAATLAFTIDSTVAHVTGTATVDADTEVWARAWDEMGERLDITLRYTAQIVPRVGLSYRDRGTVALNWHRSWRSSMDTTLRATFTSDLTATEPIGSDHTPPSMSAPYFPFAGTFPSDEASPVRTRVKWSAYDPVGICAYDLEVSVDGTPFEPVPLPTATIRTLLREHEFGHSYQYRVRATDCAGNTSPYKTAPPFSVDVDDNTSSGPFGYEGMWSHGGMVNAFNATLSRSSSGGSVTYTGTMRRVAWIAPVGPDSGWATVYVDGQPARNVDLNAASSAPRRVVWQKAWSAPGLHTIRVVPNDSSMGHPIDVDAFATLR